MSEAQFRFLDLFLAIIVYLPLWHSHCTGSRFTILVLCSGELLVHSCPLVCLQRQVTKLASGLFYCYSSLRNNNMATNLLMFTSSYDSRRFAACDQGHNEVRWRPGQAAILEPPFSNLSFFGSKCIVLLKKILMTFLEFLDALRSDSVPQ